MAARSEAPVVSVIIPCYNQGAYLDEAVHSVLAQSFRQFEIIVVNDGSTDAATNRLLADFSRPQTTVITTENQGLAAARNNGIRAASGRYILPLDADDRIEPAYLEQAVAYLENHPEVGIVYCRARLFGAVETEWALPDFSLSAMLIDNVIFCTALYRRRDWELVGGYDETFRFGWEDYDFWLGLLERGRQVYRLPEVLFSYRVASDSMVRARPRQHKLTAFQAIFHKHRQLFTDHIEVWINALLEVREPYHQAVLLASSGKLDANDGRFSRKVAIGPCRLEFDLPEQLNQPLVFQPAGTAVILCLHQVALRCESGETINLDWSAKAGISSNGLLYFFNEDVPAVELFLPKTTNIPAGPAKLVVELEYRAFDRECLPLAAQLLQQTTAGDMVPEVCPGAGIAGAVEKRSYRMVDTQYFRMLGRRWKRFILDASYRLVWKSSLFDSQWYVQQYPDIDPSLIDPLSHYLDAGWREGRNPNLLFGNDWYRKKYVPGGNENPLLHYIESGWKSGNNPSPLFFSLYYADQCRPRLKKKQTPLAHYLVHWKKGGRPNPFYDPASCLNVTPEMLPAGIDPLTRYIRFGKSTGFNPFPLFDQAYYLESNSTVANAWQVPLYHYFDFGASEGSRPNRFFDPQYYRSRYLDDRASFLDAFLHYAEHGIEQQNRPSALFDPQYYAETYPEVRGSGQHPLVHYMRQGVRQGKYPCREIGELKRKPLISIVTPVYNTDINLLHRCVHSVIYQPYPHWELCLVDDGSAVDHPVYSELKALAQQDQRIRIKRLENNQGIAAATNAAAELATGEYLAFLDHDDELSADALYHVVVALIEQDADVLYSDEDLVNLESRHLDIFYKPDFNEELLLNHNYITHFLVTRRDLFLACGGLNSQYNGAQDYDLVLKLTEQGRRIAHLPRVLYHWRAHPVSTSVNHGQKQYADEAGRKAVQAALDRRIIAGGADLTDLRFFYRVRRTIQGKPSCSLIVDPGADATTLLTQLEQVTEEWADVEIVICSSPDLQLSAIGRARQLAPVKEESAIAWRNRAALEASGDYLCFLGSGVRPTGSGWLYALMEHGQQEFIGMVGGCLSRCPEDADAHQGSIPDLANLSWQYFASYVRDVSIHHNGIHCSQHVLAVDERLCLVRRSHFLECGQYDTAFATIAFAQLDLCFRLHGKGLKNLFTPWAVAEMEATTGTIMSAGMEQAGHQDRQVFQRRWHSMLVAGDPYHNTQLLLDRGISSDDFLYWYAGEESTGKEPKAPIQPSECHQP